MPRVGRCVLLRPPSSMVAQGATRVTPARGTVACAMGGAGEVIRTLIVDDHAIVRDGLRAVLELEGDIAVVGEAGAPQAALQAVGEWSPDVVLLDLKLSQELPAEGLQLLAKLGERFPGVRVVILTTFRDQALVVEALKRGADGYVLKDVDAAELLRVVRSVHRGGSGFDPRSAAAVVRSLSLRGEVSGPTLTPRELEIVRLVARGLTNREIGRASFISESTVKFHLRNVMEKLGVHRRAEVVHEAGRLGLL